MIISDLPRFTSVIDMPRPFVRRVVLLFLLATCVAAVKPQSAMAVGIDGVWSAVPDMPTPHPGLGGTVLLDDGNVLVTAGHGLTTEFTTSSLLFDPVTQSWTQTGDINQPRFLHGNAIVKLDDGRVLIAGNEGPGVSDLASAELYDPATGIWSYTGSLNTPRRYPAVIVKLQSGKVLITGGARGVPDNNRYLASTEIYDPATGQWTYSGNLNVPREGAPGSVLLDDGRVLVAGGYYRDALINVAELYDPNSGQWTPSLMPYAWTHASMTVLDDGHVLVAGGFTASGVTANAMLFDPAANSWTTIDPMHVARSDHSAVLLASGEVLVMGGRDVNGNPLQSTEAYDPVTGQWLTDPPDPMQDTHLDVGAVTLANGDVFVAGGNIPGVSAEVFTSGNQPPECTDAFADPEEIWPPNHNFTPINIVGVTDPDGDTVTITVDSIFQDEEVDAEGSGNTAPDGRGVGESTAEVRAERVGAGNGRVYHIGFTAEDGNGGNCSGEVTVGVPHDKGEGAVPVDDGTLYDSTITP